MLDKSRGDKSFDRIYDASYKGFLEAAGLDYASASSEKLKIIYDLDSEHREVQLAVFHALWETLPDESELMDLLSGRGATVLSLLDSAKLHRLTLVDGISSYAERRPAGISRHISGQFGLLGRVDFQHIRIEEGTQLPEMGQVTLLETGVSLPDQARDSDLERDSITSPSKYRTAHELDRSMVLSTVLKALSTRESRTFHVTDTPRPDRRPNPTALRFHFEREAGAVSGWSISDYRVIHESFGTVYCKLEYKAGNNCLSSV